MNKILAILTLLVFPIFSFATEVTVGRIVDIKGSGFISYQGKTKEIKKGDILFSHSELIIEHSGQVTFTDNADHRFHLGNASSVAVFAGKVELRNGNLWVQSTNKNEDYIILSANAKVNYSGGEAIFSYDSVKGKTQLMVINGLMKISNLRAPELNLTVAEGNFSFVDMTFEEGMPRDPTPVGQKTYGQLVSLFTGIAPMDAHSVEIFKGNDHITKVTRGIASVITNDLEKKYKQDIMQMKKPVTKKAMSANNKLIIKIYGLAGSKTSATTAIYDVALEAKIERAKGTRMPASVADSATQTVLDQTVPNDFHSEIKINPKTNPTLPQYKESDKLIEQLNKL